jgi:hypothetical protein
MVDGEVQAATPSSPTPSLAEVKTDGADALHHGVEALHSQSVIELQAFLERKTWIEEKTKVGCSD